MNIATLSSPDGRIAAHGDHAPRSVRGAAGPRSRRLHARVPARGVASHISARGADAAGLPVENISVGGLFVRSANALPIGARVRIQLVRPGLKRAIALAGHVVSVVSPADAAARGAVAGMGIRFEGLDADTASRLRALVDHLAMLAASRRAPAAGSRLPTAPRAPEPPAARASLAVMPAVAPVATPTPAPDAAFLELAVARGTIEEQEGRIAQMEAELKVLRAELLRRNRTIGDLAKRLAVYENV